MRSGFVVVVLPSVSGQWERAVTGGRETVGGGVGEGRLRWLLQCVCVCILFLTTDIYHYEMSSRDVLVH